MNKILLLHGANLNFLGKRSHIYYGKLTINELEALTANEALKSHYEVICYQSNCEGDLIDKIQIESEHCRGIIINPGAFTHYSYALYDALIDAQIPVVEVHLSDILCREPYRQISVTAPAAIKMISGKKEVGYIEAVQTLMEYLK